MLLLGCLGSPPHLGDISRRLSRLLSWKLGMKRNRGSAANLRHISRYRGSNKFRPRLRLEPRSGAPGLRGFGAWELREPGARGPASRKTRRQSTLGTSGPMDFPESESDFSGKWISYKTHPTQSLVDFQNKPIKRSRGFGSAKGTLESSLKELGPFGFG